MSGLKGDLSSLKKFSAALRELPRVLAQKVATAAAPALTEVALATFNAGEDAFGITWAPGANGQHVTLRKSGGIAGGVFYVAIGTKIRVRLGVPWAKYQLGKRPIFPKQGEVLPKPYVDALTKSTGEVIRTALGVSS